eukprot:TRINITY_DN3094_c0_g1_i1.p1 TRINITY_DN3094_c0_g1~~TRINITY_DN3094_c0_g1_i1.p1  ORF type:complete len:421 (-),score=67.98 TRINITY_DN3094_c0_g1_i1:66-1328(-)
MMVNRDFIYFSIFVFSIFSILFYFSQIGMDNNAEITMLRCNELTEIQKRQTTKIENIYKETLEQKDIILNIKEGTDNSLMDLNFQKLTDNTRNMMEEIVNLKDTTKEDKDILEKKIDFLISKECKNKDSYFKPPNLNINEINKNYKNSGKNKCRAIFSINPGRAGSYYLYKIFSMAHNVSSFHEGEPDLFGFLEKIIYEGYGTTYLLREKQKMEVIKKVLDEGKIYVETSHAFIKTLYDVVTDSLLSRGCHIDVIVLRRYFPHVLQSISRTGFDRFVPKYYYNVGSNIISTIKPIVKQGKEHEYDRILAYLIDIEAKIYKYKDKYKDFIDNGQINLVDVRIEQLQTKDDVQYFLKSTLDLDFTLDTSIVGYKDNLKQGGFLDPILTESFILNLLQTFQIVSSERNYTLPPIPNLTKFVSD